LQQRRRRHLRRLGDDAVRGWFFLTTKRGLEFLLGDGGECLPLFVLFFGYSEFFPARVVGRNLPPRWGRVFAWPAAFGLLFFAPQRTTLPLGAQPNLAGAAPVSGLSGAQELLMRGVPAIKADQSDTPPPA
jgi:hypothetical protein